MPPFINLKGQKFGRWLVLSRAENNKHSQPQWLCKCVCANERVVPAKSLRGGDSKSCGCLNKDVHRRVCIKRNTTHGLSNNRVYNIWVNMRQRCFNKRYRDYKNYGARGISICLRWESFECFLADMGYPPSGKHTIDRIDSYGIYEPSNCRWVLMKVQQNNRTNNRLITYSGETKTLQQWADLYRLGHKVISYRIAKGWSMDDVFNKRPRKMVRKKP
jgi:hypothetical protein